MLKQFIKFGCYLQINLSQIINKMKILVTGSQGYWDCFMSDIKRKKYNVVGYDVSYYKDNVLIQYYEKYSSLKILDKLHKILKVLMLLFI